MIESIRYVVFGLFEIQICSALFSGWEYEVYKFDFEG